MSKTKQKKEKIRYIDDGRSLADMSALGGRRTADRRQEPLPLDHAGRFRACARTYWESVKLMFIPCLVTLGIIAAAFFIFWLLAS
jgi:hypothetical protein